MRSDYWHVVSRDTVLWLTGASEAKRLLERNMLLCAAGCGSGFKAVGYLMTRFSMIDELRYKRGSAETVRNSRPYRYTHRVR